MCAGLNSCNSSGSIFSLISFAFEPAHRNMISLSECISSTLRIASSPTSTVTLLFRVRQLKIRTVEEGTGIHRRLFPHSRKGDRAQEMMETALKLIDPGAQETR